MMNHFVKAALAGGFMATAVALSFLSGTVYAAQPAGHEIRNPDGSPMVVHWAVLTSTPGTMKQMGAAAMKFVGPRSASEEGTYILYGTTPKDNPDMNILLEVYRSDADYDKHVGSNEFHAYEAARRPILKELRFVYTEPIVMMSKDAGLTGHSVRLTYVEPKAGQVEAYRRLVKEEYTRAVNNDDGVLVMIANNELGCPGHIHSYLLFKDDAAQQAYYNSREYKEFEARAKDMLQVDHHIDGAPTNTTISNKPAK